MTLRCRLLGHNWSYHSVDFEVPDHKYTSKKCLRCGKEEMNWLGASL